MKQYAVFGNPIEHSISPSMHNSAFSFLHIKANYTKQKIEKANELKSTFIKLQLEGANITVPFKEDAFKICDEVRGIAKKIQAVNTIVKEGDRLIGYNTDAHGFLMSIEEFFPLKSALIIGAGGTAKAITSALLEKGIKSTVLNRGTKRLKEFEHYPIKTYHWNNFQVQPYDIVINTTSAGLTDENLPLPTELLMEIIKDAKYAFEVIYNKQTPFFLTCKEHGLTCKDGKDMLLYQGVLAFELFTGHKADNIATEAMKKGLKIFF